MANEQRSELHYINDDTAQTKQFIRLLIIKMYPLTINYTKLSSTIDYIFTNLHSNKHMNNIQTFNGAR